MKAPGPKKECHLEAVPRCSVLMRQRAAPHPVVPFLPGLFPCDASREGRSPYRQRWPGLSQAGPVLRWRLGSASWKKRVSIKCHQHRTVSRNICFWSLKQDVFCDISELCQREPWNCPVWLSPFQPAQQRAGSRHPHSRSPSSGIPSRECSGPALFSWHMVNVLHWRWLTLANYGESVQLSTKCCCPRAAADHRARAWELHHARQCPPFAPTECPRRPLLVCVDK